MQKPQHQQPRKKKCQYCFRKINLGSFQVHLTKCKQKETKEGKTENTIDEKSKKSKKLSIQPEQIKIEIVQVQNKPMKEQQGGQEKFQCQLCGYEQSFSELDSHPPQCPNRQTKCTFCRKKYPKNMLQEHKKVCTQAQPNHITANLDHQNTQANNPSNHFVLPTSLDNRPFNTSQNIFFNRARSQIISQQPTNIFDRQPRTKIIFGVQRTFTSNHTVAPIQLRLQEQRRSRQAKYANQYVMRNSIPIDERQSYYLTNNRVPPRIRNLILTRELAQRRLQMNKGMTTQFIKLIPQKEFIMKQSQADQFCSICCVQFQESDIIKDLKCKHDFHSKCISNWLRINSSCPLCKTDLSVNVRKKDDQTNKVEKQTKVAVQSKAQKLIESLNKEEPEDEF